MRKPLHRTWLSLRARPMLRYLREIEQTQWFSREAIAALQVRKLRAILDHAQRTVPYYREMFRRWGFDPRGVRSTADLKALPILSREVLVERFGDLRSETPPSRPLPRATGGSTGAPVRFLVDRYEMTVRSAHIARNLRWLGWDLSGRAAYVWGSDIDSREHRGAAARLRDAVTGALWLDAFALEEPRLGEYLDRIETFSPCILIGYPSSLDLLADHAIRTERCVPLTGVQTSAEMLAPRVRERIEKAFACRVLDRYGCREAGIVAHECPEGRMHVNAESVVVECDGGELLLTTLTNYAMPLIRYRNEDLAEISAATCSCGRGLPLVEKILGRSVDVIRSPGGRLIHGEFFTHLFYDVPGVRRFQVRQTTLEDLEIACVADAGFTPEVRGTLERRIHEYADARFRVRWVSVEQIPTGNSGKYRFTISTIGRRGDPPA